MTPTSRTRWAHRFDALALGFAALLALMTLITGSLNSTSSSLAGMAFCLCVIVKNVMGRGGDRT